MEIHIEVEEAVRRWGWLFKQVTDHGARVLLLQQGRPIGGFVGREDKEFLDRHKAGTGAPLN